MGAATIVDLKSADVQLHMPKELWKYRLMKYKGKTYSFSRLEFGLTSAPKAIAKVLKKVLGKVTEVDIFVDVDENIVTAEEIMDQLKELGQTAKPPETIEGGATQEQKIVREKMSKLLFHRGNEILYKI